MQHATPLFCVVQTGTDITARCKKMNRKLYGKGWLITKTHTHENFPGPALKRTNNISTFTMTGIDNMDCSGRVTKAKLSVEHCLYIMSRMAMNTGRITACLGFVNHSEEGRSVFLLPIWHSKALQGGER